MSRDRLVALVLAVIAAALVVAGLVLDSSLLFAAAGGPRGGALAVWVSEKSR